VVSGVVKRPAQKEQHLCADKAYDADEMCEGVLSFQGLRSAHQDQSQNKERRACGQLGLFKKGLAGEEMDSGAHDFVAPQASRSLRTRWSKKAGNWLALVQLACAHILLNLAVFG
jgi:hypothetical protein